MRPLTKVIEAIKKIVPEDAPERGDLFYDLDELLSQADTYKAPEQYGELWNGLIEDLVLNLGDADTEWKQKIADLMAAKIDYRTILGE